MNPWDAQAQMVYGIDGPFATLSARENSGLNRQGVVYSLKGNYIDRDTKQNGSGWRLGEMYTLDATDIHAVAFMGGQGAKARSIAYCDDGTTPTLRAAPSGGNTVPDVCYAIEGNTVDRASDKNGKGWCEDVSPILNTQDRHAVAFQQNQRDEVRDMGEKAGALTAQPGVHNQNYVCYPEIARSLCARADSNPCLDRGQNVVVYDARGNGDGEKVPTLTGDHENRITDYTALATYIQPSFGDFHESEQATTLKATDGKRVDPGAVVLGPGKPPRKYIVRRLSPLECCRLQGFPDWWCDGVEGSDTAQYKMWGNGIALPCAEDVLGRIADEMRKEGEGE